MFGMKKYRLLIIDYRLLEIKIYSLISSVLGRMKGQGERKLISIRIHMWCRWVWHKTIICQRDFNLFRQ